MLWRALKTVSPGFYIDVGAWDPRVDNVTLSFYERGWRGINVEPDAKKQASLAASRPGDVNLGVAVSDQPGRQPLYEIPETGLSTLDAAIAERHRAAGLSVAEQTVEVTTLARICEQHVTGAVHFLKIDVEGFETQVLAGADFSRFRPWIVIVEATEPNSPTPSHMAWEPILFGADYSLVYFDGLNRYYVAAEQRAALAEFFATPPNVFDDYVSDASVRKALETQESGVAVSALQGVVDEREAAEAHVAEAETERAAAEDRAALIATERAAADARAADMVAEREAADARAAELQAERDAVLARAAALGDELQALQAALREANAARETAERQALIARRDAELAHADAEYLPLDETDADKAGRRARDPDRPIEGRARLYYDASLIVRFGLETPVGLIRTEHYVAEFLARAPSIDVRFVMFDLELKSYRKLDRSEAKLLRDILFHRYESACPAPEIASGRDIEEHDPAAGSDLELAQVPDLAALMPNMAPNMASDTVADMAPGDTGPVPQQPVTLRLLLRRMRTATGLRPHDFNTMLIRYATRLLPVRKDHSAPRRLATRAVRRVGLHAGRAAHIAVHPVTKIAGNFWNLGRHVVRPDAETPADRPPEPLPVLPRPSEVAPLRTRLALAESTAGRPSTVEESPEPVAGMFRFPRGSVLLSLGNSWDYLDYDYLHRVCKQDGVRFISVIYDVIAMEFPFSTPGPPHIYHRHWVEIGHSAEWLLAISKFSADQYSEFISEPNDIRPKLTHAHLPNFLKHRSDEIGAAAVPSLAGRRFVVFCSTIETRKNHQLLLHVWDRLRRVFSAEQLPILVFVGKWGWGTESVRLLSERNYRLRNHLKILDRVNDAELIWLYRNARYTVFPALSEGYGLAAAESLSFGTPVVTSNSPALVEATEGLMPAIDPLDIVSWFDEMCALIRDDRRLEALQAAASRYRGPPYEAFAETLCRLALSGEPSAPPRESTACLVA